MPQGPPGKCLRIEMCPSNNCAYVVCNTYTGCLVILNHCMLDGSDVLEIVFLCMLKLSPLNLHLKKPSSFADSSPCQGTTVHLL